MSVIEKAQKESKQAHADEREVDEKLRAKEPDAYKRIKRLKLEQENAWVEMREAHRRTQALIQVELNAIAKKHPGLWRKKRAANEQWEEAREAAAKAEWAVETNGGP